MKEKKDILKNLKEEEKHLILSKKEESINRRIG
jgi:hypothetical protein